MLRKAKKNKVDEVTLENIRQLQTLKDNVWEVKKCYSEIPKDKMANCIREICKISDLIVKEVSLHHEKIAKVRGLSEYYLPMLAKMLHQYIDIKGSKLTGENCAEIVQGVEAVLPQMQQAFNELLNKLFSGENIDIDTDIQVIRNEFRQRGLLND